MSPNLATAAPLAAERASAVPEHPAPLRTATAPLLATREFSAPDVAAMAVRSGFETLGGSHA